jgi:hypothetical protein
MNAIFCIIRLVIYNLPVHTSNFTACEQNVFVVLVPVVLKSRTSCYHPVTRLRRPTDSQQVIPTNVHVTISC